MGGHFVPTYAIDEARMDPHLEHLVRRVESRGGICNTKDGAEVTLRTQRLVKINAILVVAMYQGLILLPVAILAGTLLFIMCKFTIQPGTAAEWIFGDGQERMGDAWNVYGGKTFWPHHGLV